MEARCAMKALAEQINELDGVEIYGRVVGVRGLMVEVAGPLHAMSVGARVVIETPGNNIPSEVIGFSGQHALLMPFAPLEGVRRGCRALVTSVAGAVRPSIAWPGRVVNALGEPIDGKGPLLAPRHIRSAALRRLRMHAAASAVHSISACARSTRSSPAAAASAWASSPARASANLCCYRCWHATSPPTSSSSG
jgi:flagellar biosynthesis/type III secretory pathway ATPase